MKAEIKPAIVRIVAGERRAIGGGVLVGERLVATCAHVVDDAVPGRSRGDTSLPTAPIQIEFPRLGNCRVTGRVVAFEPYRDTFDGVCDIAIIELDDVPEEAARASARIVFGVASHHCSEEITAYGFPSDYEGATIEAKLKSTRLGDDWLEIAGGSDPHYFVAPGVSGAGIFSTGGYLLGLACAGDTTPGLKEAFAIPIAAVNSVLARATLKGGGRRGEQDLRFWIAQLQSCAESAARAGNNLGDQLARAMRYYGDWLDEAAEDELIHLQRIHADLSQLDQDAEANLLRRYFELVPIGAVLDRLQSLARLPAGTGPGSGRIANLRVESPRFFDDHVEPLIAEIDAALAFIESDDAPLGPDDRRRVRRDLKRLRFLVSGLSYDPGEIDAVRARLESVRDLLRRTIALIQLLLGQHAPDLPPGAVFRDATRDGAPGPELVVIPAGPFTMGSPPEVADRYDDDEGPQHEVRIGQRFALGRYPVTFEAYDRFAAATGRELPYHKDWGRGRRPVINVSWEDADAYVAWLNEQTGNLYRLPSEAEWEYACRAGTTTRYSWGDAITPANANHDNKVGRTTEVGSYPANPWGLYDMHGNVWEWCADGWHDDYEGAPDDGTAWLEGGEKSRRVLRGGSWVSDPEVLRSANRYGDFDGKSDNLGFRVARTLR